MTAAQEAWTRHQKSCPPCRRAGRWGRGGDSYLCLDGHRLRVALEAERGEPEAPRDHQEALW